MKTCPISFQFKIEQFCCSYLVLCSSLLGKGQNGRDADGQVESADIEELCVLGVLPHLGLLQVLNLVLVCGREIRAQGTVVTGDDNTTATSGSLVVVAVLGLDTSLFADAFELLSILVAADAADVNG